jgi:hypothetical protein
VISPNPQVLALALLLSLPGLLLAQAPDAFSQQAPPAPRPADFTACTAQDTARDIPACVLPVPDRWRLAESLGLVRSRWWDPYNQNTLKGDRPLPGTKDWFLVANIISDTVVEPRSVPLPVGVQSTARPGSVGLFGDADSWVWNQNLITSFSLVQGSTAYKPQDWEFRLTPVFNLNYAEVEELRILHVEPSQGTTRHDNIVALQEAFVDYHIRNVSARYDFDSVRVGIQPIISDFRGFVFQDNALGVRFFGNRDNNRWQYNLAGFARLEKDTNSGLNDITRPLRRDYVLLANAYRQDLPAAGLTSQLTLLLNRNREAGQVHIDRNGFPVRPALIGQLRGRDYDLAYLGYSADGRYGRMNLSLSAYTVFGRERGDTFVGGDADIRAQFLALEPSWDWSWLRLRLSGLYASGDDDPYDQTQTGFSAIFENPQFAGADTSYWVRQGLPLIGGGRAVSLNGRNGLLPDLRSSKEQGQSQFSNPGLWLLGGGVDADLLPELRLTVNAQHLWFDHTASLEALRMQGDIARDIGWDVSAALIARPGFIQNLVFRLSGAVLEPGQGFRDLYAQRDRRDRYYSILFNMVLSY